MIKKIKIIGVPMDLGSGRRGVDMGPSALRIANLGPKLRSLGYPINDIGDIAVKASEVQSIGDPSQRYMVPIARVCEVLRKEVLKTLEDETFPLVLGGDHSIAAGTVAGASSYFKKHEQSMGLLWFDAHADMNTPTTSPSGNVHGMPLAAILGYGSKKLTKISGDSPMVDPKRVVLIGVRTVDDLEKELVNSSGIHVYTMSDIDRRGISKIMREALEYVCNGVGGLHVSFDPDVLDPSAAPGVGTPYSGGMSYREAHLAMEMVSESERLTSFEIVEINPTLDHQNKTAEISVELILSVLGKTIV